MIARVAHTKATLRARLRASRAAAAGSTQTQSVSGNLLATAQAAGLLDPQGRPGRIGPVRLTAYIAARGEPDVAAIRAAVRSAGGTVLLPIPRAGRVLDWAVDDGCYRPDDRLPVQVPCGPAIGSGASGVIGNAVQVVLVPALAVDASGGRLGQGGGYYDRLLSELSDPAGPAPRLASAQPQASGTGTARGVGGTRGLNREVRIVAVVHDDEVLPAAAIPREEHDQIVTTALTPTRLIALG